MQLSGIPTKFTVPWASGAGGSYIRTIPTPSQIGVTNGAASFTDGFPPMTFLPVGSGGTPPFGQDFNGILNEVTAWNQWQQAGGPINYDSSFQAAVGGYPNGAQVQSLAHPGLWWQSTVDNNVSNPDTGGAGWITMGLGRVLNVQVFTTTGTSTYTPTPGTNSVIVWCQAGGGSGGASYNAPTGIGAAGSGGGGGAFGMGRYTSGFSGVTVTVGAGGAGAAAGANDGNAGGVSSFGALLSCPGGNKGLQGVGQTYNTAGFCQVSATNSPNTGTVSGANIFSQLGMEAWDGVVMGNGSLSGTGGNSYLGQGGGDTGTSQNGHSPTGYGAGSSGAASWNNSGSFSSPAGGNGIVIVFEYS